MHINICALHSCIFFSHFQIIHMLEEIILSIYEHFDFRNRDGGRVSVCVAPGD